MEQGKLSFLDQRKIFTVVELIGGLKDSLERSFRDIWVQGEISNMSKPASGHLYFTLKDERAQLAAVCFRMQGRYLKFDPEDGMDVVARGTVTVYPLRGQLQMVVETMEPVGRGALQMAFEQLKNKLQNEGLFDSDQKVSLPLLPKRIGIVTSPSGAAIQDILRVLRRRRARASILIFPTRVQGSEAPAEIVSGIQYLSQLEGIDVIIVGRGGGSMEDLWAFNDEGVARAIHASKVPIISAVGHEIDFTISDFVADIRAATPSAAAEIVSAGRDEIQDRLGHLSLRTSQAMSFYLRAKRQKLERLTQSRGFVGAQSRVRMFIQRLDELRIRLRNVLPVILEKRSTGVQNMRLRLHRQIRVLLDSYHQTLDSRSKQLNAVSPLGVLERGFAIVTDSGGKIVRDPADVPVGGLLDVRVARGNFPATREKDSNGD